MAESGATLMPEHLSADIAASRRTVPAAVRPADPREVTVRLDQPLAAMLEHVERTAVQRALAVHEGNLEGAAAMLGLTRKGLYLKRQRYGFEFRPGSNR
jgi:DNA-binding NtrC family response regulator